MGSSKTNKWAMFLVFAVSMGAWSAHAAQTEASWTGAADFIPPYETTPGYEDQQLGGWGGDEADHVPRRYGQALDHVYVFVHGNYKTASDWDGHRAYFLDQGFNQSALWALSWCGDQHDAWYDILTGENATDLTVFLEEVASYTGVSNVRIVAHSQGGLLAKDMLFGHPPAGVTVTRISFIACPHGDKTSSDDAGAAACLFSYNETRPFCALEFGASAQAIAWRDERVLADPAVEQIQVVYSGTTSDDRFYTVDIFGVEADVRFSPRDNLVDPGWAGSIQYAQHGDQDHTQLREDNIAEVFAFITDPVQPECGNGVRETGEDCDGADLGGATCTNLAFDCGTLACASDCTFDTGMCVDAACGNDLVECDEVCDGSDLQGESCDSLGFSGGVLGCDSGCAGFDTSGCDQGVVCGDGVCAGAVEGEDCLSCPGDCPGKTVGAPKNQYCCGNGICEPAGEDELNCPVDCQAEPPECGNGVIETGEECDGGDLGGESCTSLGYDCGGVLACGSGCTYDTVGCSASVCGDGVAECSEVCDGADLLEETCQSQGFEGGTLACDADCQGLDTAGCTGGSACGDGTCEGEPAGEDCATCPADCPGKTVGTPSRQYCCGNLVCEPVGEDASNCPIDCP